MIRWSKRYGTTRYEARDHSPTPTGHFYPFFFFYSFSSILVLPLSSAESFILSTTLSGYYQHELGILTIFLVADSGVCNVWGGFWGNPARKNWVVTINTKFFWILFDLTTHILNVTKIFWLIFQILYFPFILLSFFKSWFYNGTKWL